MDLQAAHRYARHVALAEVGPEGQERICGATVVLVDDEAEGHLAAETALMYLRAAGVGHLRVVRRPGAAPLAVSSEPWPQSGAAWGRLLAGADVAVRFGFDDDAFLTATTLMGVPAVVARAGEAVDVISFPAGRATGSAESVPDIPPSPARPPATPDATSVVAGTLAAAEALWAIVGRPRDVRVTGARHLALPLDGTPPRIQDIPWPIPGPSA
jgi:hypothetical protein